MSLAAVANATAREGRLVALGRVSHVTDKRVSSKPMPNNSV